MSRRDSRSDLSGNYYGISGLVLLRVGDCSNALAEGVSGVGLEQGHVDDVQIEHLNEHEGCQKEVSFGVDFAGEVAVEKDGTDQCSKAQAGVMELDGRDRTEEGRHDVEPEGISD